MVERVRVNWKVLMVVSSIFGVPILLCCWWWNFGPTLMYMSAPKAFDTFFENAAVSDLSGGGITWLDPEIDIRFKSDKPVKLKDQNEYKPGKAIISTTDALILEYPDDAADFLDSSELEFWSRDKSGNVSYCIYNKRTKVCYFHYQS